MARHNVTITTRHREHPCVEVDGHDISTGLRNMSIEIGLDGIPRIEAEIAASAINVVRLDAEDADVVVSLPPGAHEALIALGWTPPASPRIDNHKASSSEDPAARLQLGANTEQGRT
ncbi:hypothetical protein ACFYY8_31550 [Streptosporangium sp. NPDC001559]|uniref:hypothetical protein n=1 Tax=Streptosporangium sp. NPDC001559 TaxID=3366187 RepID=UPI0036E8A2B0